MILLPITVLAFTTWRRISTPGSCTPDLGASLHLVPSRDIHPSEQFIPHLHLYTVQVGTTFRLTVYIDQDSMGQESVHMSTNPNSDVGSVAVRLTIRPGKTQFSMWTGQAWTGALDFTEGMASGGGHCELTGKYEVRVFGRHLASSADRCRSWFQHSLKLHESCLPTAQSQSSSPSRRCRLDGSFPPRRSLQNPPR
jgi:hypothetical protein